MPWRARTIHVGYWRYQTICPRCNKPRGFRRRQSLEGHLQDLANAGLGFDGDPEQYVPGDDGTCDCDLTDAA